MLTSKNDKTKSETTKIIVADLETVRSWQGVAVGTFLCRCLEEKLNSVAYLVLKKQYLKSQISKQSKEEGGIFALLELEIG